MNFRKPLISCRALGTLVRAFSAGVGAAKQPHIALIMAAKKKNFLAAVEQTRADISVLSRGMGNSTDR